MVEKLTPKQLRIAKAKIKGKKNKEIAKDEYPEATEHAGEVLVSRELNKSHVAQYLEQSKLQALKKHNITWDRIIEPISQALGATRTIRDKDGNEIDVEQDLATRLRASKMAADLLVVKDELDPENPNPTRLPSNINEIQLVRLLKGN